MGLGTVITRTTGTLVTATTSAGAAVAGSATATAGALAGGAVGAGQGLYGAQARASWRAPRGAVGPPLPPR